MLGCRYCMKTITIFTAGVSRGAPGPAAIGVQIVDDTGVVLQQFSKAIGNATSECAAYSAVLQSLQIVAELFGEKTKDNSFVVTIVDAQVAKQLGNEVPITHPALVPYFIAIHNLLIEFLPSVRFTHVLPEENKSVASFVFY